MALNGSNYLLNFAAQNPPAAVSTGSVGSVRLQQAQTERYPSDNETGLTPAPANTAFGAEFTSQFVLVQLLQSILKKIIELLERVTGNNDPGTTAPPPTAVTEKYPSDTEDGGTIPSPAPTPVPTPTPTPIAITLKYPSDTEDGGAIPSPVPAPTPIVTTRKYPSDSEDGGAIPSPAPVPSPTPIAVTMKYPSDTEDGGTVPSPAPAPTPVVVTKKYPSDSEDGGQWHRTVPPMPAPDPTTRWYETMKAPSDSEDGGTIDMKLPPMPRPNPDDQLIHTMKAPSDTEDGVVITKSGSLLSMAGIAPRSGTLVDTLVYKSPNTGRLRPVVQVMRVFTAKIGGADTETGPCKTALLGVTARKP